MWSGQQWRPVVQTLLRQRRRASPLLSYQSPHRRRSGDPSAGQSSDHSSRPQWPAADRRFPDKGTVPRTPPMRAAVDPWLALCAMRVRRQYGSIDPPSREYAPSGVPFWPAMHRRQVCPTALRHDRISTAVQYSQLANRALILRHIPAANTHVPHRRLSPPPARCNDQCRDRHEQQDPPERAIAPRSGNSRLCGGVWVFGSGDHRARLARKLPSYQALRTRAPAPRRPDAAPLCQSCARQQPRLSQPALHLQSGRSTVRAHLLNKRRQPPALWSFLL